MGNNVEDLFKNPWCPLFGHLPEIEDNTPNTPTNRCIDIITEARSLWGINPFFHVTDTSWPEAEDLPPEKTPEITPLILPETSPKECSKYPDWKLKAARTIARTCYSVQKYLYRHSPYGHDATPDIVWKEAIDIVRSESLPRFDQRVTDSMILSVLTIETAWSVLGDILYYDEKESGILKPAQIAGMLLSRAKEIASFKTIDSLTRTVENIKPLAKIGEETLDYSKRNFFRKEGYTWYIKLKNEEITLTHFKGLEYIVFLIKNQSKEFTLDELYLAVNKHPLAEGEKVENAIAEDLSTCKIKPDYTRDKQSRRNIQKRLQEIDATIKQQVEITNVCLGKPEDDINFREILTRNPEIESLLEERKKIEADLKKSPYKFNNPDYKKKYDAVYQAIKTVLKDIAKKSPHIEKHLENSLNYKNTPFYYNPEEPADWE